MRFRRVIVSLYGTFVQRLSHNVTTNTRPSDMKRVLRKIDLKSIVIVLALMGAATPVAAGLSPDFDLISLDGKKTTLALQIDPDKWLLLMFWATDCLICEREKPLISQFHNEHKNSDAQVVGVALEGYSRVAEIEAYLAHHKPSFPSFTGDYNDLANRYANATGEALRGTPTYLLYTPDGELVANNPGPVSPGAIEKFIEKYRKSHR